MKHKSIKLESPIEFINVTPLNPLISQCQIKVCYVSDEPNRNRSVITKEVAKELANSIPGCPIVGFYNENKEDFEEHNRMIEIANGEIKIKDTTVPYGFVDMNAKVWFQKFIDDEKVEREYLMTEGYLWTGQYPECQRVIDKGNNQSMELDEKTINATWSKDDNGKPQFFIINEAIMSKLCILGEDAEPCFEGSQITKVQFSFEDGFKDQLTQMIKELTNFLNKEGGTKLFNRFAVEIGDALWDSLHAFLRNSYPDPEDDWCSVYSIEGIYEEDGQKFAILRNRQDAKYYRLDFSVSDDEGFVPATEFVEVTKEYVPVGDPQFSEDAVREYELQFKKEEEEEEEEKPEEDPEEEKPEEGEEEEDEKKKTYSLEEYEELESKFSALQEENNSLKEQLESLNEFKMQIEREKKEEMINNFYMLSDEDKKDVVENIDKYSLDEIEAKLSIICVRNKVSFDLEEESAEGKEKEKEKESIVFTLDDNDPDETTPAWVKAALDVAKNME